MNVESIIAGERAFVTLKTSLGDGDLVGSGSVVSWGSYDYGGNAPLSVTQPLTSSNTPSPVVSVKTGGEGYHFIALHANNKLTAWGGYTDPYFGVRHVPTTLDFKDMAVNTYASCGLYLNGSASCWGLQATVPLSVMNANDASNDGVFIIVPNDRR